MGKKLVTGALILCMAMALLINNVTAQTIKGTTSGTLTVTPPPITPSPIASISLSGLMVSGPSCMIAKVSADPDGEVEVNWDCAEQTVKEGKRDMVSVYARLILAIRDRTAIVK